GVDPVGAGVLQEAQGGADVQPVGPLDGDAAVRAGEVTLIDWSQHKVVGPEGPSAALDGAAPAPLEWGSQHASLLGKMVRSALRGRWCCEPPAAFTSSPALPVPIAVLSQGCDSAESTTPDRPDRQGAAGVVPFHAATGRFRFTSPGARV